MDGPLAMLQRYVASQKPISMRDGYVFFGNEYSFPEDAQTNWFAYGSDKTGEKEYYTLQTLVFFLQKIQCQYTAYYRDAKDAKIPSVRRPDRKNLISFLRGEISTCESIDKFAPTTAVLPLLTGNQVGVVRKHTEEDEENRNAKKARLQVDTEKLKAQLASKLCETKENCVMTDDLKSLSEAMTVERIAAIKAKRLAKKRTTIISTPDEDLDDRTGDNDVDMEAERGIGDTGAIEDIIARERTYKTRTSILQSTTKEFATHVFAILDNIKYREASKKPNYKPRTVGVSAATVLSRCKEENSPPQAYNRYDQERFSKQEETSGFTIQTTASYHGSTIQALMSGQNPQPVPPCKVPGQSKSAVGTQKMKRPSKTPIIIVPNSHLSLISTLNVTDVLQDLRFVTSNEKRASGAKKENDLLIQRRKPEGLTVPYRITDNPLRLKPEDWQRVVAVFVFGPMWQFKGWPFNGNPVDIFCKISAFHLKYDDMPLDANVAKWAVTTININRTKRHLDRAALLKFWETLDKCTIHKNTILRL